VREVERKMQNDQAISERRIDRDIEKGAFSNVCGYGSNNKVRVSILLTESRIESQIGRNEKVDFKEWNTKNRR
jgi:hypothetical protein